MHLLQSLFSVRVGLNPIPRRLFACLGDLPNEFHPVVVEIPMEDFAALRSMRYVVRVDHRSHLKGIAPVW